MDDKLLTASPAIMKTAIHMLFTEKVFTPQSFIDELTYSHDLSLNPEEIERLLDMHGVFKSINIIPFV